MHVYTQLGGRSSHLEVCPFLEQGPTSSGDYAHPVRVERSLQLQTRNLPGPVSLRKVGILCHVMFHCTLQVDGFDYVCMLGESTLPAHYNASDGSVMCTIVEGNVRDHARYTK